jgi:hypothetical protein
VSSRQPPAPTVFRGVRLVAHEVGIAGFLPVEVSALPAAVMNAAIRKTCRVSAGVRRRAVAFATRRWRRGSRSICPARHGCGYRHRRRRILRWRRSRRRGADDPDRKRPRWLGFPASPCSRSQ